MKLRYTPQALAELSALLDAIAFHSPAGAHRVQLRVKAVIALLPLHPHLGARTDVPAIRRMTTRPYPYLVFYEATETEIVIYAIRHGARNPSGMPGAA